jgi:hypothetical protein
MSRARFFMLAALAAAAPAFAQFTFSDNFDTGPSPRWSNLRGNWFGHDGVYDAAAPTNAPPTHTSLPWSLGDLTLDVDIRAFSDGGIWLHSDAAARNGVLLVTGGGGWGTGNRDAQSGNSLYFHTVHNDSYSGIVNRVFPGITPGENDHLRVTIVGGTYSVYLNGSATPATTIVTDDFPTGRVGLYDYSSIQTFDNFSVTSTTLPGDANRNGRIDPDDFALTDRGFAKSLTGWTNGDFNADNVVNAADYAILDASAAAAPAPSSLVVPEPASFARAAILLAAIAPATARRRTSPSAS